MAKQVWQVKADGVGVRLDKWLADAARLGSRAKAFAALERGKIFIGAVEQRPPDAGRKLQAGERLTYWEDRPGSSKRQAVFDRQIAGIHIVFEDEALLVLDKPAGVLTVPLDHPSDSVSLLERAAEYLTRQHKRRPQIVHRIDRDTSGLVVFAKTQAARAELKKQFMSRQPERVYQSIVHGCPEPEQGTWRDWLVWDDEELRQLAVRAGDPEAQEAICHYQVLERLGRGERRAALLEVRLVTGKQNQIRVQAAQRGHQLVGERVYLSTPAPRHVIAFARQALHSHRLAFRHPATHQPVSFEAPLPADFLALLKKMRLPERPVAPRRQA